jgi:hypothetical protein
MRERDVAFQEKREISMPRTSAFENKQMMRQRLK